MISPCNLKDYKGLFGLGAVIGAHFTPVEGAHFYGSSSNLGMMLA